MLAVARDRVYGSHACRALRSICDFQVEMKRNVSHSVVSNSCDSLDCSPVGPSLHGILQARILECGAKCHALL